MACPRMSAAVAAMAGPYGQERDSIVDIACGRTARARVEESEGVVNAKSKRRRNFRTPYGMDST